MSLKLTQEQLQEIYDLHTDGRSHSEISKLLNIPEGSVGYYVKKSQGPSPSKLKKNQLVNQVMTAKEQGLAVDDIMATCEVSKVTAQNIIRKEKGKVVFIDTVYPAISTWMSANDIYKKDLAVMANVSECQVSVLLTGRYLLKETTRLNRRCVAMNKITETILESSGMTFKEAFGEKRPVDIHNKADGGNDYSEITKIYPKVGKWMTEENISITGLAGAAKVSPQTMINLLKGKFNLDPSKMVGRYSYGKTAKAVDTILKLSGLSYREAFSF